MNKRNRKKIKNKEERSVFYAPLTFLFLVFLFSLVVTGIDHVVLKSLAVTPGGVSSRGVVLLQEVHNTGAAFNLFSNEPQFLIAISGLVLLIILSCIFIFSKRIPITALSVISLLSSGILMNLIQRINYGYVIDYIQITSLPSFPVFNIADVMIVSGALGIATELTKKREK